MTLHLYTTFFDEKWFTKKQKKKKKQDEQRARGVYVKDFGLRTHIPSLDVGLFHVNRNNFLSDMHNHPHLH